MAEGKGSTTVENRADGLDVRDVFLHLDMLASVRSMIHLQTHSSGRAYPVAVPG